MERVGAPQPLAERTDRQPERLEAGHDGVLAWRGHADASRWRTVTGSARIRGRWRATVRMPRGSNLLLFDRAKSMTERSAGAPALSRSGGRTRGGAGSAASGRGRGAGTRGPRLRAARAPPGPASGPPGPRCRRRLAAPGGCASLASVRVEPCAALRGARPHDRTRPAGAPARGARARRAARPRAAPAAGGGLPPRSSPEPMSSTVAERIQHELLPRISKPNRYLGNALHAPRKPLDAGRGAGAAGLPGRLRDRDLEPRHPHHPPPAEPAARHRRRARPSRPGRTPRPRCGGSGIPLFSLESHTPGRATSTSSGFSLQYELQYTNVLMMLDLAGLPLRSRRARRAPPAGHRRRGAGLQPRADGRVRGRLRHRRRRGRRPRDRGPGEAGEAGAARPPGAAAAPRPRARRLRAARATSARVTPEGWLVPRARPGYPARVRVGVGRGSCAASPTRPRRCCRSARSRTTGSRSRSCAAARAAAASARRA